eukprot:CAMPEP_0194408754 /NCGR_PEP_ID=MMETSP0176-20130528/6509_1 /TAXON_ID=216777 /ORGANISM="Proboscia alata, Strain PI-D3" /LENGTH=661 /DNA_ID=CAMNT_0039208923 /DNA_START=64 /DNA_END=2049 /DNA_ORIENTATION=+
MSSKLYDLAFKADFSAVSKRIQTNPNEARFINDNNWTTLHILAWKKAPLLLLKAVYESYPSALQVKSKRGETPLDLARDNGAVQEVLVFLANSEKSQLRDVILIAYEMQNKMSEKCRQDEIIQENMVQKISILSENVSFLQKNNDEFQRTTLDLSEKCTFLEEENKQLKKDTASLKSALKMTSSEHQVNISDLASNYTHLSSITDAMSQKINIISKSNEELRLADIDFEKSVGIAIGTACVELKEHISSLNEKCDNIRKDNCSIEMKVSSITSTCSDAVDEKIAPLYIFCNELKLAHVKIKETVDTVVNSTCVELRENVLNLQKDDIVLQKITSSLTERCSDLLGQNGKLQENVVTFEETVSNLTTKNEEMGSAFAGLHATNVEFRTALSTLTGDIDDFGRKNKSTEMKQAQLQEKENALQKDTEDMLADLQDSSAALQASFSCVSEELHTLNRKTTSIDERQANFESERGMLEEETVSKLIELYQFNTDIQDSVSACNNEINAIEGKQTLIEKMQYRSEERESIIEQSITDATSHFTCVVEDRVNYFTEKMEEVNKQSKDIAHTRKALKKRDTLISALQVLCKNYSDQGDINSFVRTPPLSRANSSQNLHDEEQKYDFDCEEVGEIKVDVEDVKRKVFDTATAGMEFELSYDTAANAVTP